MLTFYTNPMSRGRIAHRALMDQPALLAANAKDNALIPEAKP